MTCNKEAELNKLTGNQELGSYAVTFMLKTVLHPDFFFCLPKLTYSIKLTLALFSNCISCTCSISHTLLAEFHLIRSFFSPLTTCFWLLLMLYSTCPLNACRCIKLIWDAVFREDRHKKCKCFCFVRNDWKCNHCTKSRSESQWTVLAATAQNRVGERGVRFS